MEIRLLKYALEIGRQQSFTKAAEALHVAQPSLSQQIAKLERELGLTLFYRNHNAVIPTPDGIRFLERAEQVVRIEEDLLREMQERSRGIGGELTVGTPAITGEHVLPPILEAFHLRYPQVHVTMVEDSPKTLEDWTARGIADVSILPLPIEDTRLAAQTMMVEPIILAFPPERKEWMSDCGVEDLLDESRAEPVSLIRLASAPFILLKRGYGFRQTVLSLLAEAGFQPTVAYQTSSIEMAQSLVAHGLGVTLVPSMVKRRGVGKRPNYFEIRGQPTRTLAFIYRKDRYLSLSARAFLEVFHEMDPRVEPRV